MRSRIAACGHSPHPSWEPWPETRATSLEVCKQDCHPGATFSAQAESLAEIETLEAYTEWMKDLLVPLPDGRYELRSFAVDEERSSVAAFGVFRGAHTGQDGPVPRQGQAGLS